MTLGRSDAQWIKLTRYLREVLPPVCWICGDAIDLALRHPHRMSWSLDHVKPLSTHPELAHDESNLRPAHLSCNSKRGVGKAQPVKLSQDWG